MGFAILGPLEVQGPEGPVEVSPGKQRVILALLLLSANEVVSRDRLVDELWGDAAPPNAVKALHVHVAQLRRALAGAVGEEGARSLLATRSPGYVLHGVCLTLWVGPLWLPEIDDLRVDRRPGRPSRHEPAAEVLGSRDRVRVACAGQ
jgi:hypothetical protein